MDGSKLFLIFWTLFLFRSGVISQDKIPATEEGLGGILKSNSESKQILAQLLDLKSLLLALSGSVGAMDTRIKNMENLITEADAKATKRSDAIEAKLEELSVETKRDGPKNENRERVSDSKSGPGKRVKLNCKVKTTRSIIPNLEEHMAVTQRHLVVLLNESREERRKRAEDHQDVISTLAKMYPFRVLTGVERNARIELMIKNPTVTFFKGEYMTGEVVHYQANGAAAFQGGCQNLRGIKSMRLSLSCVRIFKEDKCEGKSRALYPKPDSDLFINFLTSELPSVGSVGPCLPNEFVLSTVSVDGHKISVTKDPFNVRQVPDFVDFSSHNTYYHKAIETGNNPLNRYYMNQGRLRFVYHDIKRRHLNDGETSGRNRAIPPALGGSRTEGYNIFEQTQNNFEEWKQITDQIQLCLKADADVFMHMTFTYENASVAQPYGFYYLIFEDTRGNPTILYGFIPN